MIQMLCYNSRELSNNERLVLTGFMKSHSSWWNHLKDVIMFETERTPSQTTDVLLNIFGKNNHRIHFLVMEGSSEYSGWLPSNAWNWMNNELKPEGWILERKYRQWGIPHIVELFGDMELLDIFGKSIGRKRTISFNYPKKEFIEE